MDIPEEEEYNPWAPVSLQSRKSGKSGRAGESPASIRAGSSKVGGRGKGKGRAGVDASGGAATRRPSQRESPAARAETQADIQAAIAALRADGYTTARLLQIAALPSPIPPFEPVCPETTLDACRRVRSSCPHPHFAPIIRPWTDPSLGHCSYLNLCYGEATFARNPSLAGGRSGGVKQCRYLHFRVVPPAADAPAFPAPEKELPKLSEGVKRALLAPGGSHPSDPDHASGKSIQRGDTGSEEIAEGQWLNLDVRDLDPGMLGQFQLILMDPPWDIHMSLPYGTLSDDECRALPIPALQPTWALLGIWVTGRAMELGRELLGLWGYRRIDEIVWVKVNQLGGLVRTGRTGHWLNHTCEHLLIALKLPPPDEFGRSAPIPWETDPRLAYLRRGQDGDVLVAEVRETSRKPDEMYGVLERMVPRGRRLEIFGRKHNVRPGWLTIGNQLGDDHVVEPVLKARLAAKKAASP